jgi:uncharacterized protein (TIGR00730 family)
MQLRSVCVFCGSNPGLNPEYLEAAQAFGRTLAEQGLTLVYGGGNIGLMGAVADAALAAGGQVIGVIPTFLKDKEVAHLGLSELVVTHSMHERKAKMAELSDAFVALPGGLGTFEELFEMVTWSQLSIHGKPVALYNVNGFYDRLLDFVRHAAAEGFLRKENLALLQSADSVEGVLSCLRNYEPKAGGKWLSVKAS